MACLQCWRSYLSVFVFQLCSQYLIENLTVGNACDVLQAAVTYGQDDLKNKTVEFIELNTGVSRSNHMTFIHTVLATHSSFTECMSTQSRDLMVKATFK